MLKEIGHPSLSSRTLHLVAPPVKIVLNRPLLLGAAGLFKRRSKNGWVRVVQCCPKVGVKSKSLTFSDVKYDKADPAPLKRCTRLGSKSIRVPLGVQFNFRIGTLPPWGHLLHASTSSGTSFLPPHTSKHSRLDSELNGLRIKLWASSRARCTQIPFLNFYSHP